MTDTTANPTQPAAAAPPPEASVLAASAPTETKPVEAPTAPPATSEASKPAESKPAETLKAVELKLPEGFQADVKQVDAFKALASEVGLDSAKAQRVFDSYVALEKSRTEALDAAVEAQSAKWRAEVDALPEFTGPARQESMADVQRALARFGGKPLGELLDAAGLGNHPLLVKAFADIGKALREDTIAGSTKPGAPSERRTDAEIFYGPAAPKES